MTDTQKIIDTAEFTADLIVRDMEAKYPTVLLHCDECGREQPGSWSYIKSGWPKCHGYTMRLETGRS